MPGAAAAISVPPRIGAVIKAWAISFLVTVLILETVARSANNIPLHSTQNFVFALRDFFLNAGPNEFDPVAGWALKEGIRQPGFITGRYGIRMNGEDVVAPREGGILIVGDSFAAGSQVSGPETAPAELERLTNLPVINAAAGGYGPDQSMLRAEHLAAILKPRVVVLDHTEDQLSTLNLVMYGGAHRPYFTLRRGRLVRQNDPIPRFGRSAQDLGFTQSILGHSYLFVWTALRLKREDWLGTQANTRGRRGSYVRLACKLFERFEAQARAQGILPVLVLRYPGQYVGLPVEHFADVFKVTACAEKAGVIVIDTYRQFRALYDQGEATLQKYYVMGGTPPQYGHMSSLGNAYIAQLIESRLREVPSARSFLPSDGLVRP